MHVALAPCTSTMWPDENPPPARSLAAVAHLENDGIQQRMESTFGEFDYD